MSALPAEHGDLLNRILALTPAGQRELRDPHAGLSLPQRWLLVHVDGESSLGDIASRSSGTAQVERLPRDAAKLVSLGMAYDVGEPGPSQFGPTTQQADFAATVMSPAIATSIGAPPAGFGPPRSRLPMLAIGGALALAGVGAGYLLWSPKSAPAPAARPVAPAASMPAAPVTSPTATADGLPPPMSITPGATGPGAQPLPVVTTSVSVPASPTPPAALPAPAAAAAPAAVAVPDPVLAARPATTLRGSGAAVSPVTAATPVPTARRGDERPGTSPGPYVSPSVTSPAPEPVPAVATPPAIATSPPPAVVAPSVAAPAPVPVPVPVLAAAPAYPPPTASPTLAAVAAPALRPLSNPAPSFPRDALSDSRREVTLTARLSIAASGEVTRVEFSGTTQRDRAFERSARAALLQWRFPEGAAERSYSTNLVFRLE